MCYVPLLPYNFFATVLTITLSLVSANTVILVEWVHVEEPPMSIRSEPAMDYLSRAVWDILYADNACILSRPPWRLAKMMKSSLRFAFALTISKNKVETICVPPPRTPPMTSSCLSGRASLQEGTILH